MTGRASRTTAEAPPRIAASTSRRLRPLIALAAVLAAGIVFLESPARVTVTVDGEQVAALRSHDATVQDVLAQTGVAVAPADEVAPAPSMPVADGMTIELRRAHPVTVVTDQGERPMRVVAATVGEVLDAAGVARLPGGVVRPPVDAAVRPGMEIEVVRPMAITVRADGDTAQRLLGGGRVADALRAAGVTLGPADLVFPPAGTPLARGMQIQVRRIAHDEQVEEVALPFGEVEVDTDELYTDQRRVVQEGQEGLRRDHYRLQIVDGEVRGRVLLRQEVVAEPVDRIVEVGTRQRPVARAVPSGSVWDALAGCESNGNWQARGTYHGGLQFHPDTWNRWKPAGYPDYAYQATREQQIEVGRRLQAAQGWSPWPHCSRVLGLR